MGAVAPAVKAVVAFYAPSDLEQLARSSFVPEPFRPIVLLGRLRELSPIHHVRSGVAPFLLIHGTADPLVSFEQSRNFCRAIRKSGSECDLLAVNGGTHGLRRWESAGLTSYKRLMIDWLKKRVG